MSAEVVCNIPPPLLEYPMDPPHNRFVSRSAVGALLMAAALTGGCAQEVPGQFTAGPTAPAATEQPAAAAPVRKAPVVTKPVAPAATEPDVFRTGPGKKGPEVRADQVRMKEINCFSGKADGVAGPSTVNGIIATQKGLGVEVDSYIGPVTRELIIKAVDSGKKVCATPAKPATKPKCGTSGIPGLVIPGLEPCTKPPTKPKCGISGVPGLVIPGLKPCKPAWLPKIKG